ncbi:hypothetical protein [Guptibacillus sedimenti]|uniref:hypothetical protein n=1 Tax=Guptibacillus sedimenti TaxID=3025680 RepID=UPI0023624ED6|nr:hypothetical protein [Pseudalkalibacillus sedimenti]
MKSFLWSLCFVACLLLFPTQSKAVTLPCTMVLNPVEDTLSNAKGSALVYKVQLNPPSFPRTNVSVLAVHLPKPSTFGAYDRYEGFTYIPDEISWRFKLYPTPEENPTWAGRFDLITAKLKNALVQVRATNSNTEKLGPVVLTNEIKACR